MSETFRDFDASFQERGRADYEAQRGRSWEESCLRKFLKAMGCPALAPRLARRARERTGAPSLTFALLFTPDPEGVDLAGCPWRLSTRRLPGLHRYTWDDLGSGFTKKPLYTAWHEESASWRGGGWEGWFGLIFPWGGFPGGAAVMHDSPPQDAAPGLRLVRTVRDVRERFVIEPYPQWLEVYNRLWTAR